MTYITHICAHEHIHTQVLPDGRPLPTSILFNFTPEEIRAAGDLYHKLNPMTNQSSQQQQQQQVCQFRSLCRSLLADNRHRFCSTRSCNSSRHRYKFNLGCIMRMEYVI